MQHLPVKLSWWSRNSLSLQHMDQIWPMGPWKLAHEAPHRSQNLAAGNSEAPCSQIQPHQGHCSEEGSAPSPIWSDWTQLLPAPTPAQLGGGHSAPPNPQHMAWIVARLAPVAWIGATLRPFSCASELGLSCPPLTYPVYPDQAKLHHTSGAGPLCPTPKPHIWSCPYQSQSVPPSLTQSGLCCFPLSSTLPSPVHPDQALTIYAAHGVKRLDTISLEQVHNLLPATRCKQISSYFISTQQFLAWAHLSRKSIFFFFFTGSHILCSSSGNHSPNLIHEQISGEYFLVWFYIFDSTVTKEDVKQLLLEMNISKIATLDNLSQSSELRRYLAGWY